MTETRDPFNLIGFTVAEKYAVDAVVGETGYALLYRAVHVSTKQPVALQAFKALGEFDADSRERLLRIFIKQGAQLKELAARAPTLRAPRDIGPLTMRDGKWVPYMVFEWLDGTSLDTVLVREREARASPRSLEAAMSLLEPIALALELAHEEGLSHLDVKPSNVFIGTGRALPSGPASSRGIAPGSMGPLAHAAPAGSSTGGVVRLLDFGTAAAVSRALSKTGASVPAAEEVVFTITPTYFTPTYAAPEQFLSPDPPLGPWTDVFALALVLTEMITGVTPNDGDVGAIAKGKRLTPRARGAPLHDGVDAVFARALLPDHRQRFGTAAQFWNALRAALGKPHILIPQSMRATPPSSSRGEDEVRESPTPMPTVPSGAVPFATSSPELWPAAMSNRAAPAEARDGVARAVGRVVIAAFLGAAAAAVVIGALTLLQRAHRTRSPAPSTPGLAHDLRE